MAEFRKRGVGSARAHGGLARRFLPGGALLAVALAGAACSSGPASLGVASLGATKTTAAASGSSGGGSCTSGCEAEMLKYSECMRAHGVPNFPDPTSNGDLIVDGRKDGINAQEMGHASKFCQHLLPGLSHPPSQADLEQAESEGLKYATCMRSHGVPGYPDPTISDGAISFNGVGPMTARYNRAQRACQSLLPGNNVPVRMSGGPGS